MNYNDYELLKDLGVRYYRKPATGGYDDCWDRDETFGTGYESDYGDLCDFYLEMSA